MESPSPSPFASEQNLGAIRTLFDEFDRGEFARTFELFDEAITWDARALDVYGGIFRGHEGVRAFWQGWLDAWEQIEIVSGPDHHPHGNQVLSWWHQRNRGRGSGVPVEMQIAFVWTFQNGRIVHTAIFPSLNEALTATGLVESSLG